MAKSVLKELKQLNKEKRDIFECLIYRPFTVYITSILVHTKITPNLVTIFSVIFAFIAAIFYLRADYISLVIGTIFFNTAHILDIVDGDLARYTKKGSVFGAWLDGVFDRIVEYIIFSSLTLGLYFKTTNPTVLILGFFALTNTAMITSIRSLNRVHFGDKPNHEFHMKGDKYIGGIDTFAVLVTIATLLNHVYYFLLIYAVLGIVVWIRQICRRVLSNYKLEKS